MKLTRMTRQRGAATAVLALSLLIACGGTDEERVDEGTRIAQVRTVVLEPETWTESIRTYGTFEAAEEVSLSVDFSATARRVHFRDGDRIAAGELLVELDRKERELVVTRAQKNVEDLKAQLDRARGELRRSEDLYVRDAISREELDRIRAEKQSLSARYGEALAGERFAQRELEETTLISPVSGRVARRLVEPGETVLPGQVLGVVQAVDTLRVVSFVSEKNINALRVGSPARVTTPGVRGQVFPARIESLGAEADPRTGNFTVKLTVENDGGLLRAGMTARVELEGLEYENALLIPAAATVDRNRRRVVFTVVDGKAVEVEPVLAATLGERIPVLDGLEAGAVLIVDGMADLVDGSPVAAGSGEAG